MKGISITITIVFPRQSHTKKPIAIVIDAPMQTTVAGSGKCRCQHCFSHPFPMTIILNLNAQLPSPPAATNATGFFVKCSLVSLSLRLCVCACKCK